MKPHPMLEVLYGGQFAFHAGEHQPDTGPHDALKTHLSTEMPAPPRHTTQAERATMQPDRQDLEWPYCRGAWIG